jgi:arabinose-5-phosphate isomerase
MEYKEQIKTVFDKEIEALRITKDSIDESLNEIIDVLAQCQGKVVFSGVGKSGCISAKIASTFSSLGTPSFFLHPTEAKHGDLGLLDSRDVVVLVSYSGESSEVTDLIPYIKSKSITTIAVTGNSHSTLYRECDLAYCFPEMKEATRFGLAPTSSTTAFLVLGDALAVVLSEIKDFQKEDFAALHPGGVLGERL